MLTAVISEVEDCYWFFFSSSPFFFLFLYSPGFNNHVLIFQLEKSHYFISVQVGLCNTIFDNEALMKLASKAPLISGCWRDGTKHFHWGHQPPGVANHWGSWTWGRVPCQIHASLLQKVPGRLEETFSWDRSVTWSNLEIWWVLFWFESL